MFHPAKISQPPRGCVTKRELICTPINCQEKARDFIRDKEYQGMCTTTRKRQLDTFSTDTVSVFAYLTQFVKPFAVEKSKWG